MLLLSAIRPRKVEIVIYGSICVLIHDYICVRVELSNYGLYAYVKGKDFNGIHEEFVDTRVGLLSEHHL